MSKLPCRYASSYDNFATAYTATEAGVIAKKKNMTLSAFQSQPDENTVLRPKVVNWLKRKGIDVVVVDGLFDLLVIDPKTGDLKFIELKVRLQSQRRAIPLSRKQWEYLADRRMTRKLSSKVRYLIYCSRTKKYSFCESDDLASGIQSNKPKSTSYIRKTFLDELRWENTKTVSENILTWVKKL